MNLKKIDIVFVILIIALTFLSIDLLLNINHQRAIENISKYEPFQNLATGLIITFWVCVIGNLLPFPTPYTWVVCFSSQPFLRKNLFIPLLVGFIGSLGCLIGEMGGYAIGRGAAEIVSEDKTENLKKLQKILITHPKLAPLLIYLFGLTPLNDDLLIIPLGLIKYDVKKTVFFCWLGKFSMMLIFAYNFINICSLIGGENWLISIISLYFVVILIYLFLRVDIIQLISKKPLKEERTI
ncbi:MAG: VTT domain-containing protein [Candidatus Hermodarchaeota archaeon]